MEHLLRREGRPGLDLLSWPGPGTQPSSQRETDARPRRSVPTTTTPAEHTHVIDTSVLLSDPRDAPLQEQEVVLPVVVITELEGKRHHPELGYFARQALRILDDLRVEHGRLDAPVPVGGDGGTLRVELNHTDPSSLPAGFRLGTTTLAFWRWPRTSRTRVGG